MRKYRLEEDPICEKLFEGFVKEWLPFVDLFVLFVFLYTPRWTMDIYVADSL